MRPHRVIALGMVLSLFVACAYAADDSDLRALREQLKALTERVNTLQAERNATKSAETATSHADNWRALKAGMTEPQVLELLGPPAAKFRAGGQLVWYYKVPGRGAGSVLFYDDGRAASFQSPPAR